LREKREAATTEETTVSQRLPFLKVPLWTAVPIPPLEIAIEDQ
jgi:hypothetical protein